MAKKVTKPRKITAKSVVRITPMSKGPLRATVSIKVVAVLAKPLSPLDLVNELNSMLEDGLERFKPRPEVTIHLDKVED